MSRRLIITIFCFVLGALFAQEASAATRTVDRVDDPIFTPNTCTAAPNDCSLRGAIEGAAHGDVINFDPSLNGQTITENSATWISKNISIVGPGANLLTISGGNTWNVFVILFTATSVSISGLTVANGYTSSARGAGIDVESSGTTTSLSGMVFTNNFHSTDFQGNEGGAIRNIGTMTINNCVFNGNRAQKGGAIANHGALTIDNSSFSGNSAGSEGGGAIYNAKNSFDPQAGSLTVTNTSFANNSTSSSGGAIYVFTGAANISNSTFSGNQAGRGGAIWNNFSNTCCGLAVTNLNHVTITQQYRKPQRRRRI